MTVPADVRAAMKPPGSAPKPINRSISNAPRPAPQISGGWAVLPTEPCVSYVPRAPSGFVAFSNTPEMLAASAESWRVPAERMPAKADLTAHAGAIEDHLARTPRQAAGIGPQDGSLWWAPDATWRTPSFVDRTKVRAAVAAMHGNTILFPGKYGVFECYPILSCRALALAFGAENPPGAPAQSLLNEIREIDHPQKLPGRRTRRAESAPAPTPQQGGPVPEVVPWMLDYTRKAKDAGRLAKRDDAIKACMDEAKCTYRVARSAWEKVPREMKRAARQTDRAATGHSARSTTGT